MHCSLPSGMCGHFCLKTFGVLAAPGVVCEAQPKANAFAGLEFAPTVCPAMGAPSKGVGLTTPPAAAPEANAVAGAASICMSSGHVVNDISHMIHLMLNVSRV
jgi:hypothetical protein